MSLDYYRAFEDKHRGSRELISGRLKVYLPFVLPLNDIYPKSSGVDIGCGRGEWLELLKENHIPVTGVDMDEGMLEACYELKLDVKLGDGIAYLSELDSDSLVVISAFHIVEHISFEQLQFLVEEALRVLKRGGILILETPNAENIKVGTENFYLDPTHIKPIPSSLLSFLPEFYGYERTKVLRLQEDETLLSRDNINLLDVLGGVSPDYAVIAQKAAEKVVLEKFDDAFKPQIGLSLTDLTDKFECRLLRMEAKAEQAEVKAEQAEVKAEQAEVKAEQAEVKAEKASVRAEQYFSELDIVYNSWSWRITAPLRWFNFQMKLLRKHGVLARIKSLREKMTRSNIAEVVSYINLAKKAEESQAIESFTPQERRIYDALKLEINKNRENK